MKSKLLLTDTKDMSAEEWLKYRRRGVGASEVGVILGLNPYKCNAQLFSEKCGEDLGYNAENMAQFLGKEQEPFIKEMWEFWDGSPETMIKNFRAGKKVRRAQRVNHYVHNPDFPWLFVSLDYKINRDRNAETAAERNAGEGALEVKTIAGYVANQWEAETPPAYVMQVQTQIFVCEFLFGELAVLKDGRDLDVLPFSYDSDLAGTIIKRTKDFWDRVEEGRKIKTAEFEARRNFNYKEVERLQERLTEVEPPPDGSEAYAKYLKERYKIATPGEQSGTDEQLVIAEKDSYLSREIKKLEEQRREAQNKLKNVLRDGADILTFGDHGQVSWKANKNGVRTFNNRIKSI